MKHYLNQTPVALEIPFSDPQYNSNNVQDAIIEGAYRRIRSTVTGTSQQATTNTAFTQVPGMSLTIPATGRYKLEFSARCETVAVNGEGAWALFLAGTQITATERRLACETNILGLLTLSSNFIDAPIHSTIDVDCTAGQVVQVGWRSVDGVEVRTLDRVFSYERIA